MKLKKQKIGWWISTMLFDIGIILLAQSGWESRGYWLHPLLFGLFLMKVANLEQIMFWLFLAGNALYYIAGIALAFAFKDNRACRRRERVAFIKGCICFSLERRYRLQQIEHRAYSPERRIPARQRCPE